MPSTLRTALAAATLVLVGGVVLAALVADVRVAALVLAAGLVVAAGVRIVLPARHVPTGRGRAFDVTVLLVLGAAAALLAPWGLALSP